MSDALLSPAGGGAMWAAAGAAVACSARRVGAEIDDRKIPLMGVLAAFVFAAQMINFTIPGTGASGHLGGGMILAILLGPHAALLAMASILTVQALFFADGGLLALGCNIFNLGFLPAFIAYPLIYRPLAGDRPGRGRLTCASLAAAVIGLQLGALGVVLQTVLSGISNLSPVSFAALMLPIHLVIGVVEGLVTVAVVIFVMKERPEVLAAAAAGRPPWQIHISRLLGALAAAALLIAGLLSWFSSERPDGLEWALGRAAGTGGIAAPAGGIHAALEDLQERMSVLSDYAFRDTGGEQGSGTAAGGGQGRSPAPAGISVSGIAGVVLTLLLVAAIGFLAKRRQGEGGREVQVR